MEYAVAVIGGKQYIIEKGQKLTVEKQVGNEGDEIKITDVVLYVNGDKVEIGKPFVKKEVQAKILSHKKDVKKVGMKYHPGGYRKKMGHRQPQTVIQIENIN